MKKKLFFCLFFLFYSIFFACQVYAADPHLELNPSSGTITTAGVNIDVNIDTGGQAVKSAKAVINFEESLLQVLSVSAGDFFDDVSYNIYNSSGQVVINANLSLDSMLESKTGIGTLATLSVKSLASSGATAVTFDCTQGSSTDSNINNPTPQDIIVCSSNVNGSYNLSSQISTSSAAFSSGPAIGGDSLLATNVPVPVTGTSWPTLFLFLSGIFLLFLPLFNKIEN